ncbi:MAG: hypothetical protein BMS9Abin23_0100 [Thermodesulfobacteriota bacterium]|nr:MAG: hypothetical protein BMS9Abin23_0100 [Thermodesulfobacteriota bacterium]
MSLSAPNCEEKGRMRTSRAKRGRVAVYFLLLVAAIITYAGLSPVVERKALAAGINPHDFSAKQSCSTCHSATPPELKFDTVTTCTRCHEANAANHPVVRHPIGKAPGIAISKRLPLSKDGLMVCYTCHDQHARTKYPQMLRVPYIKLCSSCHRGY